MAYTSDLRVKNILTDIDYNVRQKLHDLNINVDLQFRLFDESKEDALLWENGGLTFNDPIINRSLGSNDGAWAIDNVPLLVVEGTFGTERGQFGDGQLNRISHPLGPAMNGYYGLIMVPLNGRSFIKKGTMNDICSENISYNSCPLRKSMALFAINASSIYEGFYLIMDPYKQEAIKDLLLQLIKKHLGLDNTLQEITDAILSSLRTYVGNFRYGERSKEWLDTIYYTDGTSNDDVCRYFTHNLESLTLSSKRDGHGLLGKNLIDMHLAREKSTAIFIRMGRDDFNTLLRRNSKEFQFIYQNPRIDVYNFDDLVFDDHDLRNRVYNIRRQNLFVNRINDLKVELQNAFQNGTIKIIKHN